MKLAMEIPLQHWDEFVPECDFHYALCDLIINNTEYRKRFKELRYHLPLTGELWLDNSFNELKRSCSLKDILKAIEYIEPTHVVTLEEYNPKENLKAVVHTKQEFSRLGLDVKLVSCWRGTKNEMDLLSSISDIIALPYDSLRNVPISKWWMDSKQFHYFGFKNLDEIRRYCPRSIDTSVPIRAAILGIDLKERERRPKNLPLFNLNMKLTKSQVKLALENIKAIKGAFNGR